MCTYFSLNIKSIKSNQKVLKCFKHTLMHYWQEVLKVMEITGRNPRIWEFFFLLRGLKKTEFFNSANSQYFLQKFQGLVLG